VQRRVLAVTHREVVELNAHSGAASRLAQHTANQSRASTGTTTAMRARVDQHSTLVVE
jgi:hypothetical protein